MPINNSLGSEFKTLTTDNETTPSTLANGDTVTYYAVRAMGPVGESQTFTAKPVDTSTSPDLVEFVIQNGDVLPFDVGFKEITRVSGKGNLICYHD